jgi:hypothetical protein
MTGGARIPVSTWRKAALLNPYKKPSGCISLTTEPSIVSARFIPPDNETPSRQTIKKYRRFLIFSIA